MDFDDILQLHREAMEQESFAGYILHLLLAKAPTEREIIAFNNLLNCYAEHGFNLSTTTGSATASGWSGLASSIGSAQNSLWGALHGFANVKAAKFIKSKANCTEEELRTYVREFFQENTKRKAKGLLMAVSLKQQASNQSSAAEESEYSDQNSWANSYQPYKPAQSHFAGGSGDFSKAALLGAAKSEHWHPGSKYLYKKSIPQMMFKPLINNFQHKMANKMANGVKMAWNCIPRL